LTWNEWGLPEAAERKKNATVLVGFEELDLIGRGAYKGFEADDREEKEAEFIETRTRCADHGIFEINVELNIEHEL
jgi:hypothetical protein